MSRTIVFTTPGERTNEVVSRLGAIDGVIGMSVHRSVVVGSGDDLIRVNVTNRGSRHVLAQFAEASSWGISSIAEN
jgi:hypothetical protein